MRAAADKEEEGGGDWDDGEERVGSRQSNGLGEDEEEEKAE